MAEIVFSQKQRPVLHHNGFCYHFHSFNVDRSRRYWRCAERDICNARCTTGADLDSIVVLRDGTTDHQHNAGVEGRVRRTLNALRRTAQEDPNALPLQVLRRTLGNVRGEELLSMLPGRNSLRRQVNRVQNRNRPTNPVTMHGVEIPMQYRVTNQGEPFLIHDSGAEDEERILIFSTFENVRYLSASGTLFCDGTFKTAPTQFAQLFTIHGVIRGYPMPLVYALTTRRRQDTYRYIYDALFAFARRANLTIAPSLCIMDFELANMNAIREVLPNAEVRGCLFHFAQSLWRKIASLGLASEYNSADSSIRATACMLFGLPFVPLRDVTETFDYVAERAGEALEDLVDYVERVYVRGRSRRRVEPPRFPPETWNVYTSVLSGEHRTNNAVEGWHNKFQRLMVVHHPSLWRFIEVLKDEQQENEQTIVQILSGHTQIRQPISQRRRRTQLQITEIVRNYAEYKTNGQIDVYLRAIAYRLKCNPAEQDDGEQEL